jgi:hypothetical protein
MEEDGEQSSTRRGLVPQQCQLARLQEIWEGRLNEAEAKDAHINPILSEDEGIRGFLATWR